MLKFFKGPRVSVVSQGLEREADVDADVEAEAEVKAEADTDGRRQARSVHVERR